METFSHVKLDQNGCGNLCTELEAVMVPRVERGRQFLIVCSVVFCILVSLCAADSQEFYVDPVGGNDSNDGSSGDPFLTIRKALETVATDSTQVIINLAPGQYSGTDNIGLSYSLETFLQFAGSSSDAPATFECSAAETAFIAANSFSINGQADGEEVELIEVWNCLVGIKSTNPVPQIQVINTNFYSNNVGISTTDLTTLYVRDSGFFLGSDSAIQANGNQDNETSTFQLNNVWFNTTGINVAGFNTGQLNSAWFVNITGSAFSVLGGAWDIEFVTVQNLQGASAFLLNGTNQLAANFSITSSQFLDCDAGANDGAGIHVESANVALTSVFFQDCHTTGRGGGFYQINSIMSSMSSVAFTNCSADYGGGIDLEGTIGEMELMTVVFTGNSAASNGSCISCCVLSECAVYLADVDNTVTGSDNVVGPGGVNVTCAVAMESYFTQAVSSQQVSTVPTLQANSGIPWWVWLLVSGFIVCLLVSITSGIAYYIYHKRRERYAAIE